MRIAQKNKGQTKKSPGENFIEHLEKESWTHTNTVTDVLKDPVLILDKNLCVIAANNCFYQMFQVEPKDIENKVVGELGNGQWNIPALQKLLRDIPLKNTFFKGFEIAHTFPIIGHKVMILNAREIYWEENTILGTYYSAILLVIEDITEMVSVVENLASHIKDIGA